MHVGFFVPVVSKFDNVTSIGRLRISGNDSSWIKLAAVCRDDGRFSGVRDVTDDALETGTLHEAMAAAEGIRARIGGERDKVAGRMNAGRRSRRKT